MQPLASGSLSASLVVYAVPPSDHPSDVGDMLSVLLAHLSPLMQQADGAVKVRWLQLRSGDKMLVVVRNAASVMTCRQWRATDDVPLIFCTKGAVYCMHMNLKERWCVIYSYANQPLGDITFNHISFHPMH